ncbi:hypothetical protein GE09DRAFT_487154 [Coniochaeta sp. 2T2.1]|nr:hypothetical protein GE09DRAFT_487154 [Coniochaeta sp. 2T2.1]
MPDTGLTTTGQLDWTALSRSTITVSLDVAARFANAGVDAITIGVGRALGSRFSFPPEGQMELMSSLNQMKGVSSISNTLWFGFGIKHVVRTLAETEQGALSVALCAALCEGRAKLWDVGCIFREMCLEVDAPPELIPSIHQWNKLAGVCEGSLRRSHFPRVYHHFFRLLVPQGTESPMTEAKAMAKALVALGRLSKGEILNAVFAGTGECALLAAIAQCLLRLPVEIQESNGVTLYASQDTLSAKALFIRTTDEYQTPRPPGHSMRTSIVQKTYYEVTASNLFDSSEFYGPTVWFSVLSDTFGDEWEAFKAPHLAQALHDLLHLAGSQSLLQSAPMPADGSEYGPFFDTLLHRTSHTAGRCECSALGHGSIGHVQFARNCLPELEELAPLCNGVVDTSIAACLSKFYEEDGSTRRAAVAITVVTLTLALRSLGEINPAIPPSPRGLWQLFELVPSDLEKKPLYHLVAGTEFNHLLYLLTVVFTGERNDDLINSGVKNRSAISSRGLCIYYPILRDPSLPVFDAVCPMVVPGHISSQGRSYKQVIDDLKYQQHDLELTDLQQPATTRLQLIASDTQDPNQLEVLVRGTSPQGKEMHFRPATTSLTCMQMFSRATMPTSIQSVASPVTSCDNLRVQHSITLDGHTVARPDCADQSGEARLYVVVARGGAKLLAVEFGIPAARFLAAHYDPTMVPIPVCVLVKIANACPSCFVAAAWEADRSWRWWSSSPTTRPPKGNLVLSFPAKDGSAKSVQVTVTMKPEALAIEDGGAGQYDGRA